MTQEAYRLPRTVVPSRYDLTLEPDLEAGTFTGEVDIAVRLDEPLSEIVLNADGLELSAASLTNGTSAADVTRILLDPEAERAHLELAQEASAGAWTLHLAFAGELNPKLVGFYRSTYVDHDGTERVIGTTQFEATDARKAFPCWDEPDRKAVFSVSMIVPDGLGAWSNGPEVDREPAGDGRVRVRFADTMPMSTYLVAWIVGPLEAGEPADAAGVPVSIVHVPGKGDLAGFARDAGVHALTWFADYYGVPYPDAKVDHVALPDFAQGAMENLGCITYREQLLLADPDRSTQEELVDIAETIAHEVAHMWFGDLVTMRWWNGIWLNEAFATFMSYLCVDAWRPDWEVWSAFTRLRTIAFEIDSLESTRPIEFPVHSPDEARGMFDTLTYTKGGAVLRMLEQWLGPERFRDGIRRYLRTHAHGNTETHDLWEAIEAETGEPVRRVMDAWIFQEGYPAISVTRDGDRLRLSQHRYLPSDPSDGTTWPVPLIVRQRYADEERVDRVLVEADGLELPTLDPDAVVVANSRNTSFVRTWYDDELRARLVDARPGLEPLERYALIDDAWAEVFAGEAGASSFCDLVAGFVDEDELTVWQAILTGLSWCDRFVEGQARDRFRDFVRELVSPALGRLGWEAGVDDSDLVRVLRGELVRALAILGDDPEATAHARELELQGQGDGDVDPHLAAAAVDVVASAGGAEDYERYWSIVGADRTPQEKNRYLTALPRFRDEALFLRTLEASLTDEVRSQDVPFLLARSELHRDLGPEAWRFVAEHWDEVQDRVADSNLISVAAGIRFLTHPDVVDEVQSFFETHDIPQAHLMLLQQLERQRVGAALRERATAGLAARFG